MTPSNTSPEHNRVSTLLRAYDRFLLGCDTVIGYVVTIAMAVLTRCSSYKCSIVTR